MIFWLPTFKDIQLNDLLLTIDFHSPVRGFLQVKVVLPSYAYVLQVLHLSILSHKIRLKALY